MDAGGTGPLRWAGYAKKLKSEYVNGFRGDVGGNRRWNRRWFTCTDDGGDGGWLRYYRARRDKEAAYELPTSDIVEVRRGWRHTPPELLLIRTRGGRLFYLLAQSDVEAGLLAETVRAAQRRAGVPVEPMKTERLEDNEPRDPTINPYAVPAAAAPPGALADLRARMHVDDAEAAALVADRRDLRELLDSSAGVYDLPGASSAACARPISDSRAAAVDPVSSFHFGALVVFASSRGGDAAVADPSDGSRTVAPPMTTGASATERERVARTVTARSQEGLPHPLSFGDGGL